MVRKITEIQLRLLEDYLLDEKERIRISLIFYCSLRLEEVLRLRITDFYWEEWKKDLTQVGKCLLSWRNEGEQIIIIPVGLMNRIARYIRSDECRLEDMNNPVFLTSKELEKFSISNQERSMQRKVREAGIKSGLTLLDNEGTPIKDKIITPTIIKNSFINPLRKNKNKLNKQNKEG